MARGGRVVSRGGPSGNPKPDHPGTRNTARLRVSRFGFPQTPHRFLMSKAPGGWGVGSTGVPRSKESPLFAGRGARRAAGDGRVVARTGPPRFGRRCCCRSRQVTSPPYACLCINQLYLHVSTSGIFMYRPVVSLCVNQLTEPLRIFARLRALRHFRGGCQTKLTCGVHGVR